MGNSASTAARVPLGVSSLVAELGENEVQYEKSMGSSRFLKAVRAQHTHGRIVVKTFIKPDPSLTLRHLVRRLRKERETLANVPNVLTYQQVIETDRAGYLIRQWLSSNLYDRISTRPFLTVIEKKWITFQLLCAMKATRQQQIAHGDLKTENILVTTSLSVYVTDFAASFKPTFLPLDDPADFSFFFDTSGRRTCYVAPERFYTADSEIARQKASLRTGAPVGSGTAAAGNTSITSSGDPYSEILGLGKRDGKVTEAMDVFALGCVLAELWRDGVPMFTLSQLFKYRERQYDVSSSLSEISEAPIREMLRSMMALEPCDRHSFAHHLENGMGKAFPASFATFIHPYLVDLQRFTPRSTAAEGKQQSSIPPVSAAAATSQAASDRAYGISANEKASLDLRRQADLRLERLYDEWSHVVDCLEGSQVRPSDEVSYTSDNAAQSQNGLPHSAGAEHAFPVQLNIPGVPTVSIEQITRRTPSHDGPALIMLSPLLANLRNAARPSTKEHAIELLLHLSARWLSDETVLDRVLPYMIALLDDPASTVRVAALRAAAQLLQLVSTITAANESVCLEYIFPNVRRMTTDPSASVRTMYAACLSKLVSSAHRFLQQAQALRASGVFASDLDHDFFDEFASESFTDEASYDISLQEIRIFAQEQATALLTDASTAVKRVFLANIEPLCRLFGMAITNDVLLSHMITYLNDKDWQLRDAFFESIVKVVVVAGQRSAEEYVVPLMVQALSDPEESVVVRVIDGLRLLAKSLLLSKAQLFDLVAATAGFLCHFNLWVRQAAARFIVEAASHLDAIDLWAVVYPTIRPLLRADVSSVTETQLLASTKTPLSREITLAALSWAINAHKSAFWRPDLDDRGRTGLSIQFTKQGAALSARGDGNSRAITLPRSEEDDGFIDKLRALGLSSDDELKLVALRGYLWKLSKQSRRNTTSDEVQSVQFDLQDLDGVTPQTIFFSYNKGIDGEARRGDQSLPRGTSLQGRTEASLSSEIARRRLQGQRALSSSSSPGSAMDDVRRRMEAFTPLPAKSPIFDATGAPASPSRSAPSNHNGLGMGKAAPSVAAESSANATGTMAELAARLQSLNVESDAPAAEIGSEAKTAKPGGELEPAFEEPIFRSTYDGQDPYIQAHLETIFVRNFRDRNPEFGPKIAGNSNRRRLLGRTAPRGGAANGSGSRRPEGKLVAYFNEHTAPVTDVAVSSDHVFFATAAEDGTIKVWDTARLEKNVTSRSRATYTGHSGRVTALITLDGTHCCVSAATDGSLHVWRIDVATGTGALPKYGKPRLVSNFQLSMPGEHVTCLMQSSPDLPSAKLILGTSHSRIIFLDLRTMQVLQVLRNPDHFGPITCICADKKRIWLLAGTMGGNVLVWDLRFELLVKRWRVGDLSSQQAGNVRVTACAPHPSKGKGRWVLISYEQPGKAANGTRTLIETWNIDGGVLVETYEVSSGQEEPGSTPQRRRRDTASARSTGLSSPAAAIEQLVRLSNERSDRSDANDQPDTAPSSNIEAIPPAPSVKAFLASTEGYSSGSLGSSETVSGGWLDAGKLAAEADRNNDGDASSTSEGRRPAGYIISGGEDCRIRFWDLGRPERSVCIGLVEDRGDFKSTSSVDGAEVVRYQHHHSGSSLSGNSSSSSSTGGSRGRQLRSPLLASQQTQQAQAYMRSHRDAITALAVVEWPFRCIVAGDRTGAVKVWE